MSFLEWTSCEQTAPMDSAQCRYRRVRDNYVLAAAGEVLLETRAL